MDGNVNLNKIKLKYLNFITFKIKMSVLCSRTLLDKQEFKTLLVLMQVIVNANEAS